MRRVGGRREDVLGDELEGLCAYIAIKPESGFQMGKRIHIRHSIEPSLLMDRQLLDQEQ